MRCFFRLCSVVQSDVRVLRCFLIQHPVHHKLLHSIIRVFENGISSDPEITSCPNLPLLSSSFFSACSNLLLSSFQTVGAVQIRVRVLDAAVSIPQVPKAVRSGSVNSGHSWPWELVVRAVSLWSAREVLDSDPWRRCSSYCKVWWS